ncbi:dihydroorotate oxidase B, catalytic subunit [Tissierella praeacuta DSM 18095]|uniref:Dihydroorotate dehydrogenase n=1 Tax=Tissierella praeacuta DSM 18095 TaxID=1123404 RepID=A0A1M4V8S5_9FIRM|nr:dihydroorotate dehydrogenase [Tissierella praeacuta]SHE65332.1 dihydroorotate oxidase B, catalytic subunit [Tissierella praeacuta DSM 18095]SUP03035.1 Dihydroorotate dehydrogenase B (NAD(+)), catalytic subunit [Tissierella praeacuta]
MTRVNICGIEFKNPVIAASGTFGFGREFEEYFPIEKIGGICTKGLTLNKRDGNRGIRIYETPSGIMNSIGLQNPGVRGFIDEELPFLEKKDTVILANLGGSTLDDYLQGIELLNNTSVDFIELNISCPNVKEGGMAFGIKCNTALEVVKETKKVSKKPMIVKLSPNAENIKEMAYTCVEAGADGLSLVNTFNALAIDIYKRRPIFNNITAGLSGPCIKPIALRMVYEVNQVVDVPIIGIGGIMTAEDAIEFIMAGATAIQVGSSNFIKPNISMDIIKGIEEFMEKQGVKSLKEIRGII